jgi:hypothetical protein
MHHPVFWGGGGEESCEAESVEDRSVSVTIGVPAPLLFFLVCLPSLAGLPLLLLLLLLLAHFPGITLWSSSVPFLVPGATERIVIFKWPCLPFLPVHLLAKLSFHSSIIPPFLSRLHQRSHEAFSPRLPPLPPAPFLLRAQPAIEVDHAVVRLLVGGEKQGGVGDFFGGAEALDRDLAAGSFSPGGCEGCVERGVGWLAWRLLEKGV